MGCAISLPDCPVTGLHDEHAVEEAGRNHPTDVGTVDVPAECGRAGGVLDAVVTRAGEAGVLRPDFLPGDLATLVWAMSKVIAMYGGDDADWRRHLGFVLNGLRRQLF